MSAAGGARTANFAGYSRAWRQSLS